MSPHSDDGSAHRPGGVQLNGHSGQRAAGLGLPSQRGTLTRYKVVTAAVVVIDTGGVDDFTLRAVADRLGMETMALYRYFPSRKDPVHGVVEHLTDDLFAGSTSSSNTEHWQELLNQIAFEVRSNASAHPPLFRLISTTRTAAPWIRPPLRNLHTVERFLETFHRCGFNDTASLTAYHAFTSFLLGHLLLEINLSHAPVNRTVIDLPGYPRLCDLQIELGQDHSAEEFSRSLNNLISGVHLLLHS